MTPEKLQKFSKAVFFKRRFALLVVLKNSTALACAHFKVCQPILQNLDLLLTVYLIMQALELVTIIR